MDFKQAFDFVVSENLWFKLFRYGIRGNILKVIRSMHQNIKPRVKTHDNYIGDAFDCSLGVRQREGLPSFLFSMYLNDIEEEFMRKGAQGIDVGELKLLLLLCTDDIVLFCKIITRASAILRYIG